MRHDADTGACGVDDVTAVVVNAILTITQHDSGRRGGPALDCMPRCMLMKMIKRLEINDASDNRVSGLR